VRYPMELADSATLLDGSGDLGSRGNASVAKLTEHGLQATVGLDVSTIQALLGATAEEHIVEFCPTDRRRFAGVAACREWVGKHRAFVAITDASSAALLAYGWSGPDKNKHVPGADITTAYRVTRAGQVATKRVRESADANFRLGMHIGELVIATAVHRFDAAPNTVSLETWGTNGAARHLYELLGFVQLDSAPNEPATRPTLLPVDADVRGNVVRVHESGDPLTRVVDDERCFYVLRNYG
jgi:ribosomal protein S18 acetylase RimI-like enzyme